MSVDEQARDALRRVVLGELAEDSDEFRQALRSLPELTDELRAFRDMQAALETNFGDDAAEIAAEAAGSATDADRHLVADALVRDMRRGWLRVLLVAAMLAITIFFIQWRSDTKNNGPLGQGDGVRIERVDERYLLTGLRELAAGDVYTVLLYIDGQRRAEKSLSLPPFELPDEWTQQARGAQSVELVIGSGSMDDVRISWQP